MSYGTCSLKVNTGGVYTLYVNHVASTNPKYGLGTEQSIGGTYGDAFDTIMDAVTKAYELCSSFTDC